MKDEIVKCAKKREGIKRKEENGRLNYLKILYEDALDKNIVEELQEIKRQMEEIYRDRAQKQLNIIRVMVGGQTLI